MDIQEHNIVCVIDDRRKVFNLHIAENVRSDVAEIQFVNFTKHDLSAPYSIHLKSSN